MAKLVLRAVGLLGVPAREPLTSMTCAFPFRLMPLGDVPEHHDDARRLAVGGLDPGHRRGDLSSFEIRIVWLASPTTAPSEARGRWAFGRTSHLLH
jgi:hypothetical protein